MTHHTRLIVALSGVAVGVALAQEWREGFENGLGSAKTYYDPPDGMTLTLGTEGAAEGRQYLRGALPGKRALEGMNVTATGLSGGRVATVSAQVRGKGELWLCLISSNGWLYSPATVPLSERWQTVSLSKVLVSADTLLGIHFISHPDAARVPAVFEVDDVQVRLAPPPRVYAAEVGPWRFEAEDFAVQPSDIAAAAEASGGQVTRHDRYMALAGLPFPRVAQPVSVWVRVLPVSAKETYRLETTQAGQTECLRTAAPAHLGAWQWVAFPALSAGEVGESFSISLQGEKDAAAPVAFDQVALSTRPDLTPETLAAAPLWASRRPLAVVARTAVPPVVDGQGNDPCWRNTVACTGFVGLQSLAPAQAETSVRLCYDAANLYLLIECREPILNVAQQRRGEFLAKVAARDAEVYQDDAAIILLDPGDTGRQVFDVTVNALGTVADARCPGPDLWESRDLAWNARIEAKGQIGEDVWTAELAIPFADLGAAPQPGDTWQAGFGRIARARQENTSWHPARNGFHDPYQLGTLVFAGAMPGVSLAPPAALQPGRNVLTAALVPLAGEARGVALCVATEPAASAGRQRAYAVADLGDAPAEVTLPFLPRAEGELRVEYGAFDAATLQPLVLTPTLPRAVKSSQAQVSLATDGPYELYLNGELVCRGAKAAGEPITAALGKGANVFALRLAQGTAAIAVATPGSRFTAESWRLAPADTKDAILATLDDRSWPLATPTGEHPVLGPVVGRPGTALVLRRTLLWEKTRVWPTPEPAFYLARGQTQHFSVITDGLPGRALEGWTTYLATPPELEIVGSSGFYGTTSPDQPTFQCTQLGTQTVNGRELQVARVTADKPVLAGRHYIMSLFNVFVRSRAAGGDSAPAESEIIYWSTANEGSVSEPPQRVSVRLLPPLAGRQPKALVFQLWGGWYCNLDDLAMREEILRCAQAAGFNDLVAGDRWTSDHAPAYGVQTTLTTNFEPWELNLAPYLKEHPDTRLVSHEGKPSEKLMCMTLLLGDGWPAVEALLAKRLEAVRPHTLDIDYEYSPYAGPHSCYCPRCLAAFREAAHLPAETALDAASIREKHTALWVDFMARRVAQLFARFKEATHRLAPGTRFSAYSGYQTPANPEMYGIDWRYIGDLQACDAAGAGYGEPEALIAKTVTALQGIPLRPGLLSVPYEPSAATPLSPLTKAGVLRLLLAGTGGLLAYDRLSFDGRVWYAVAEVSRLAAAYEDVLTQGKPSQALPGFEITQVQVLAHGPTTLVCALNLGGKPVEYALRLPADSGAGSEFYSGRQVHAGEQVSCALPPGDAAVYVLQR